MGTDRGQAAYLQFGDDVRDPAEWTPEASRRARGLAVWAALRSLGRSGVVALVERCCTMAQRVAAQLSAAPGVTVHNDVVLNQVLVGFDDVDGGAMVTAVQQDGTCWPSGTVWRGQKLMRISVSNWQTDASDVDRSVAAILRCYDMLRAG
jgi:glutamate/tyrosine decarboxylase-like PLP-dependent enzyme